jgi:hypothetical protein
MRDAFRAAGVAAALSCAAGPAPADDARCQALAEAAPRTLAGHRQVRATAYPQRELGFATQYQGPAGAQATIYFFDAGRATVDANLVRAAFASARGDIDKVNPDRGVTGPRDLRDVRLKLAPALELAHMRSGDAQGRMVRDYLAVGQSGDCLVKMRYTVALDTPAADAAFLAFAAALAAAAAP